MEQDSKLNQKNPEQQYKHKITETKVNCLLIDMKSKLRQLGNEIESLGMILHDRECRRLAGHIEKELQIIWKIANKHFFIIKSMDNVRDQIRQRDDFEIKKLEQEQPSKNESAQEIKQSNINKIPVEKA